VFHLGVIDPYEDWTELPSAVEAHVDSCLCAALEQAGADYPRLVRLAETASRVMLNESADWRLIIKARPVSAT